MSKINGEPFKTVIHKLRPVKEIEEGYWKLRWKPIKHVYENGGGTWNIHWSKSWSYHRLGLTFNFALPQDGSQYGRYANSLSIRLGLWYGDLEFWVKWGFRASTSTHGDGVDGIDLAAWGIT